MLASTLCASVGAGSLLRSAIGISSTLSAGPSGDLRRLFRLPAATHPADDHPGKHQCQHHTFRHGGTIPSFARRSTPLRMPRFPKHASSADGLSDRVFGQLLQRSQQHARRVYPLHVGDTYLDPLPSAQAEAQKQQRARAPAQLRARARRARAARRDHRKVRAAAASRCERECVQVMSGATAGHRRAAAVRCSSRATKCSLPAPFWPLIRGAVRLRGATAVEVPLLHRAGASRASIPSRRSSARSPPRTAAIYLNTPHNPTGDILSDAVVDRIARLAVRHDLWVLTDEVYEDLWYESEPRSVWLHARAPRPRDRDAQHFEGVCARRRSCRLLPRPGGIMQVDPRRPDLLHVLRAATDAARRRTRARRRRRTGSPARARPTERPRARQQAHCASRRRRAARSHSST